MVGGHEQALSSRLYCVVIECKYDDLPAENGLPEHIGWQDRYCVRAQTVLLKLENSGIIQKLTPILVSGHCLSITIP
jgi:hypothetical protein